MAKLLQLIAELICYHSAQANSANDARAVVGQVLSQGCAIQPCKLGQVCGLLHDIFLQIRNKLIPM